MITHNPYDVQIKVHGKKIRQFAHDGQVFVEGRKGSAYTILIKNNTNQSVEAVVSVDAVDVVNGEKADFSNGGYIIRPHGSVEIDGFRRSMEAVAQFKFGSREASYNAQMSKQKGHDQSNIGVIGVAIFKEKQRVLYRKSVFRGSKGGGHSSGHDGFASMDHMDMSHSDLNVELGSSHAFHCSVGNEGQAHGAKSFTVTNVTPSLGTEYGSEKVSPVTTVSFERATPDKPEKVFTLRYDSRQNLEAMGISFGDTPQISSPNPFPNNQGFSDAPPNWRG